MRCYQIATFYGDCFSDETADDLNLRGTTPKRSGQVRGSVGRGDSQEITYVPTSVLKGQTMELSRAPNGKEVRTTFKVELSRVQFC